jgi:pimeloyl-ACP methyl ester carboxylesterase
MSLLAVALVIAAVQAAPAPGAVTPLAGTPFERHVLTDASGREVTYYISRPRGARAPLLLRIQGSGCSPIISQRAGMTFSSEFNLMQMASEGQFATMVVEKPYAGQASGERGTATGCSAEFNADFTAASWLAAIQASLRDARRANWIDPRRTLVMGGSEGAVMATLLAAADPGVTDVIAIGGSGTSQAYDFIVSAYTTCFDVPRCLAQAEQQLRAIAAKPDSATDFAWGHPYKRWASFFRVDPGEALLHSRARTYIAFGTADRAVPALSQEIMVAKLLAAGRDVTVRRVPDAGHGLVIPGAHDDANMDREYRAALAWFWQGQGIDTRPQP